MKTQQIKQTLLQVQKIKYPIYSPILKMFFHQQLPCIYHPELNITNFCQDQDCLMPLCPSCIRQHSQYHEQTGTKPSYFNIYQALIQTDTLITNNICNLEKDKKRNVNFSIYVLLQSQLILKIQRLPSIIHQKISQVKAIAYKIVQKSFNQLERDAFQIISKINQELNMHSLRKSQTYEQNIVRNLQELYDLVEGLKTQSCLSDMIFYLKEKRFEVEDLHNQISHYLYANQNYQPYIEISRQTQQSLSNVLSRMLKFDRKQLEKSKSNRQKTSEKNKNMYQNSYHIGVTPTKSKHNQAFSQQQDSFGTKYSAKRKNSPYKGPSEYHEQISRSSLRRQGILQHYRNSFRQQGSYRNLRASQRQKSQNKLSRTLGNQFQQTNRF